MISNVRKGKLAEDAAGYFDNGIKNSPASRPWNGLIITHNNRSPRGGGACVFSSAHRSA